MAMNYINDNMAKLCMVPFPNYIKAAITNHTLSYAYIALYLYTNSSVPKPALLR